MVLVVQLRHGRHDKAERPADSVDDAEIQQGDPADNLGDSAKNATC